MPGYDDALPMGLVPKYPYGYRYAAPAGAVDAQAGDTEEGQGRAFDYLYDGRAVSSLSLCQSLLLLRAMYSR